MKIRTQFIITMLLFGMILVVIAVSAIIANQRREKARKQEMIAADIAQGASELSYLANDYLIYRESQQLSRWQSRFASFSSEVARLRAEKPEQQALIRNIQANERRLKQVFDSVASAVRSPTQERGLAPDLAFLQVSWSRMAVQSQGVVSDASRLSQLLHQQMDQLTNTRTMLIYFMVGLFGVFLLASYVFTYRRVLKSIATLQAGTAVIGSGNLDFTVEEKENDEIGDLSRAFNQMTTDLKAVTASKADLEREVTQRRQAEEELRQQREWLRVTLSSIGDAVIASDTQGRITFLNPAAETLTGWQLEETLGQPIQSVFRIINEKTHVPAEDLAARVLNEKRVVALANDTALVTKDGRKVPIEDSAAPIKDATGNVTGVVLVFHDVTERRRVQAVLRESEERFRAVFESSSDCILVWDRQYNYLYANQAAIDHVGTTRDKVIGKNIRDGLGHLPDFMHLWMERVDRAFATGESFRVEDAVPVGDRLVHSESQVSPIRDAGGQVFAVGVVYRDITERKQAEEALRKAHERAVWLARFPDENPNPVVRASADGGILYCNPASVEVREWSCRVGGKLPSPLLLILGQAMTEKRDVEQDLQLGENLYSVSVAAFPGEGYVNVYGRDITERKQAEEKIRRQNKIQEAISHIFQKALTCDTEEELGRMCLAVAEELTGSKLGFIGEIGEDGWLHDIAISDPGWELCAIYDQTGHRRSPGNFKIHGLYGRVLRDGRSLLVNDPGSHPDSIGVPEGHPQLTAFLGVPFVQGGKTVGMVAMGNRESGYTEAQQQDLEALTPTIFHAVSHKRAEVALRESEERLKRAQEISHVGSWELEALGNRLTWSDEVYRIFGLQPQEFGATYEAFLEAVYPDDRAAVDAAYSSSLREGRASYEIEHRVVRKSTGELRTVHERCEHIRDASGRVIRSVGMVHDITERKRAEETLRQRTLELQQLTETLERRVRERTEELAQANSALRQLSTRLLSAQEEERKRVAGELHDTIGACLSGIKFKVEDTLQRIGKKADVETKSLKTIVPVIQEAVEECRRIQLDLRPSMLDDLGLLPTLSWFSRKFQTIYSRIRVDQKVTIEESDVPDSLKIVVYRVIQEAMNNCAKHSEANSISLCLQKIDGNMELLLEDNGQGFDLRKVLDTESTRRGFGLTSMRERTELSGGSFDIESVVGKGTIIRARWPI